MTKPEIVDNTKLPSIIEAKLTKGEMVDILLGEVRGQLRAEVAAIQAEMDKLGRPSQKDLAKCFTKPTEYSISIYNRDATIYVTADRSSLSFRMSDDKLPPSVKKWAERYLVLQAKLNAAENRLRQFNERKSDAKTMALRDVLEKTAEGRVLLEQIEVLKATAMQRMQLTAGAAR